MLVGRFFKINFSQKPEVKIQALYIEGFYTPISLSLFPPLPPRLDIQNILGEKKKILDILDISSKEQSF